MKRAGLLSLALIAAAAWIPSATAQTWVETPSLEAAVKAGKLPPVAERVPKAPRVIDLAALGREPGRHGGTMRMLMGDSKDIRMMVVYGYSRLVGFNEKLELVADILESFEVQEDRVFTFKLRPGHKWSDGQPFTAEDFRYFWEDVANDKTLSPGGPPVEMVIDGEPAKFEVVDPTTVRYSWSKPNPRFLPALAGARPLYIMMPAHYLKQFHGKYRDAKEMADTLKSGKMQNWARLHERMSRQYRPENPKLPSLDPWINTTKPPSTRFEFTRNPFYHRVDTAGRQLPYVDDVVLSIGSAQLVPAKIGSGDADLQARYVRFDNYTFLKEAEKRGQFKVLLWERGEGSRCALLPNLNVKDDVWRPIVRDVRFRRAISIAINRREINQAIFYGLATESADTVLPASPLFKPEYQKAWTQYDIKLANQLLDEAGLKKRDWDGTRLLPDGRRAEIIVETAGESTEEADVLALIRDSWAKVGLRLYTRPTQRDLFRSRIFAGETLMSMWSGLNNAIPTAATYPMDLVPTQQDQLQWPAWGQYVESLGKAGEPPDLPAARQLVAELKAWSRAGSTAERTAAWHRILKINAEEVFTIGTVNRTLQPVVINTKLRNVPEKAVFGFEPGAFFGFTMPDTYWYDLPTQ